jgi:hypothetical protein
MNANVILRAPLDYARPHFRPGQVLPDTELTWLANFSCIRLEAESRRHGWGVAWGLLARATTPATIEINPGVAVDQRGRMFSLEQAKYVSLSELIDATTRDELKSGDKSQRFVLWLEIASEPIGQPLAGQTLGAGIAEAPVGDLTATVRLRAEPPRDAVIGKVTLQPAGDHAALIEQRKASYEAFAQAFNKSAALEDLEAVGRERMQILAHWVAKEPVSYFGIPLAMVDIKPGDPPAITAIERMQELYIDTRDDLPAIQNHINVAPVLGLTVDEATAWLEARGIRVWMVREFGTGADSVASDWDRWRRSRRGTALRWALALKPGSTASLYHDKHRVVVVHKGPNIERALTRLWWLVLWFGAGLILALIALVVIYVYVFGGTK